MNNLFSREDIKKFVIEAIENRFDEDTKNTILKSKSFDGEDTFIYSDLKLDSLDVIEFILEVEYNINQTLKLFNKKFTIDDNIVNKELTLGNLIDYIYNNINKD